MTDAPVRVAGAGAGWIGRDHVALVRADPGTELSALVDPVPAAREVAGYAGVPLHGKLAELFATDRPDAVTLATSNRLHLPGTVECLVAGVPVLVEKPVTATLAEGCELVAATEASSPRCWSAATAGTARCWTPPPGDRRRSARPGGDRHRHHAVPRAGLVLRGGVVDTRTLEAARTRSLVEVDQVG